MSSNHKKQSEQSDEILKLRLKVSELEAALLSDQRVQAATQKAEEKFVSLAEHSLVGIYIIQDRIFTYVNPKAADIFGYTQEEFSSRPLSSLITEEDCATAEQYIHSLLSGEVQITHSFLRGKRKDGTIIEIEFQGTGTEINGIPSVIGTFLDITPMRRMEAEVQNTQKLESLSSFAGSIAREYNDILTAIMGNLALAKMYAKPGYEVYDVLIEGEKASLRARDLTSQLLSFAAGGIQLKKVVIIHEFLRDLIRNLEQTKIISCELTLPENLWTVEIDEAQVSQAIKTLLECANPSSPQKISIKISAENMSINQASSLPLSKGRYIAITIAGKGSGITEGKMQSLFEPFSVKDGEKSGLEYASALAIVQKHKGHIAAVSSFDGDMLFRLFLPATQETTLLSPASFAAISVRKGRILVMDDEEIVRVVVERLLFQCGFDTELSKNGDEMLRLYREAKEAGRPFDAVILDLIIQNGMGGQEAMKKLAAYDPEVRVVVSSGYSNNPIMANFREYGFSGFLPKPYKLDELKRVMNDIIAGKS